MPWNLSHPRSSARNKAVRHIFWQLILSILPIKLIETLNWSPVVWSEWLWIETSQSDFDCLFQALRWRLFYAKITNQLRSPWTYFFCVSFHLVSLAFIVGQYLLSSDPFTCLLIVSTLLGADLQLSKEARWVYPYFQKWGTMKQNRGHRLQILNDFNAQSSFSKGPCSFNCMRYS